MLKGFGIGALLVALIALVAIAALRETTNRKQEQPVAAGATMGMEARPALTAAEEKFAHELWAVHDKVKQAAVKMTFAGVAYKTGDIKRAELRARVAPQVPVLDAALKQARKIVPPASAVEWHGKYVEAIGLYREAAAKMAKVPDQGDVELIEAQELSARASTLQLVVGDQLWPGEYKPN
jgi:hypothetical protein